MTKIRSITKYYKISWNDLPAVTEQTYIETLNQNAQPVEKKAAFSNFT